ncbi:MAG: hypothetical protein JW990_01660, partial [Thermoleophilia bacterium]|nr:hypothetical protein [Thermoleophilia bacterium]
MSAPNASFESGDLRTPWQRIADQVWAGSAFLLSAIVHVVVIFVVFANIAFHLSGKQSRESRLTADVVAEARLDAQPLEPQLRPDDLAEEPNLKSPMLVPAALDLPPAPVPDYVAPIEPGALPAFDMNMGRVDVLARPSADLGLTEGTSSIPMIERVAATGGYRTLAWRMGDQISITAR